MGLLAVSASTYSLPFMPIDARGLAMGGTGVASSRLAHAPAYNPSLLTQVQESDDFAILLPQIAVVVADDGAVIKTGNSIKEETTPKFDRLFESGNSNNFRSSLEGMKTASGELSTAISNVKSVTTPAQIQASKDELVDKNGKFKTSIDKLRTQIKVTNSITDELNAKLGDISGSPLRARAGIATAFAFPSKKMAFAVSVRNDAHLSAQVFFTQKDRNLLSAYGRAIDEYTEGAYALPESVDTIIKSLEAGSVPDSTKLETLKNSVNKTQSFDSSLVSTANGDVRILEGGKLSYAGQNPKFNSQLQIAALNILEIGLSAARIFDIENRLVSFGITPKVLSVNTFHYGTSMQNKTGSITDSRTSYVDGNIDLGASYRFGETSGWMAAVSIKNLIPSSYKTKDAIIRDKDGIEIDRISGPTLKISPQLRVGGSYENSWFMGTAELDITKNAPVAFEQATRYLSLGTEFNLYDHAQLRMGLRTNMSADDLVDQSVLSFGVGLSPSIVEMNLAVLANPSAINMTSLTELQGEFGLAFEMGLAF